MPIQPQYEVFDTLVQRKIFRIPNYQRAYSWGKYQREDLFEDIKNLASHPDNRHHFMASIVCSKRVETETVGATRFETFDIVDGQQRLTTLIILLKAIAKELRDDDQTESNEKRILEQLLVKGDNRIILLQANHDSAILLRSYLETGVVPSVDEASTHARANLRQAIIDCESFVRQWTPAHSLVELLLILKNRIGFVFYELDDRGSVYTVFEVLNSRGLPVDDLDKCKSMLLGIAYEKTASNVFPAMEEELHQLWSSIYALIGTLQIPGHEILRFTATLFGNEERSRPISSERALEELRTYCQNDSGRVIQVSQRLEMVTQKLKSLYETNKWAVVTEIAQARLLAVALLVKQGMTDAQRKTLLRQWENVTFRIFGMCGKDARTKIGEYTRLACNIILNTQGFRTFADLKTKLTELGSDYDIDASVEELKEMDCYNGWEKEVRYFLYCLERHLAEQEGTAFPDDIWNRIWNASPSDTIEHIFPQTPNPPWRAFAGWETAIHRIGNLLVLSPGLNSAARNFSFDLKKQVYRRNPLKIMDRVLFHPGNPPEERVEWGLNEIVERENILLEFARQYWADIA